jgi:serine/threonine protein kinase
MLLFARCVCALFVVIGYTAKVFEPCAGGELFDPISNRQFTFSEYQASVITRNLLLALQSIHDAGFVHRDLKPENILLVDAGVESQIKVGYRHDYLVSSNPEEYDRVVPMF